MNDKRRTIRHQRRQPVAAPEAETEIPGRKQRARVVKLAPGHRAIGRRQHDTVTIRLQPHFENRAHWARGRSEYSAIDRHHPTVSQARAARPCSTSTALSAAEPNGEGPLPAYAKYPSQRSQTLEQAESRQPEHDTEDHETYTQRARHRTEQRHAPSAGARHNRRSVLSSSASAYVPIWRGWRRSSADVLCARSVRRGQAQIGRFGATELSGQCRAWPRRTRGRGTSLETVCQAVA
jgi:hypothetical protein